MNKTKIEWCDYTVNPVKGLCPMACSYCYARRMYKRYKWDETVRFDQTAFFGTNRIPAGSRVFVGSTMELFGPWVKSEWLRTIFTICEQRSDVTWIFLTKQPQRLPEFSPFPDNCWVGVSITGQEPYTYASQAMNLRRVQARVKFLSVEPFLRPITIDPDEMKNCGISWVIIGQQTPVSAKTATKMEWIVDIVEASDKAGAAVFLKNNLSIGADVEMQVRKLRQEIPYLSGVKV